MEDADDNNKHKHSHPLESIIFYKEQTWVEELFRIESIGDNLR